MAEATPRAIWRAAEELGIAEIADQLHLPVITYGDRHILGFSMLTGGAISPSINWACPQTRTDHQRVSELAQRPGVLRALSEIASHPDDSWCCVCNQVMSMQWYLRSSRFTGASQAGAQALEVARCELERRAVLGKRGTPSKSANVLQRQRDQLEDVLSQLSEIDAHANPKLAGALLGAFEEVEERVRRDLGAVRSLQKGGALEGALHRQVRTAAGLQPEWAVDETPTMVGFAPYRGSNRLVRAVVEATKLAESRQAVVVRVPAWVAHFLLHTDRSYRVQAVAAPDEALARTAALLWDPTQDGPLGSLAGALEVAGEIEQ